MDRLDTELEAQVRAAAAEIETQADQDESNTADELRRLAELSIVEYERARKSAAKELDMRPSVLDSVVKAMRNDDDSSMQGRAVEYPEIEPHPEPVNGLDLFDALYKRISRHMAMPEHSARVAVLWVIHTHCFNAFTHSPRLAITAPEKDCGKTVLLYHLIGGLVPKPQPVDNMPPAVYFRLVEGYGPTILIDEVDSWLKTDSQLIHSLNGGHEPHGTVPRCVGDNHEVRFFSTWGATAMAGINLIGKLPPATASRSIVIELQRALADEVKEDYDERKHEKELHKLRQMIARWVQDNLNSIKERDPVMPEGVINRQANKWRPLATIAEVVGGPWSGYVEAALFADGQTTQTSKGERLLADIGDVISARTDTDPGIFTHTLIKGLCELDDSPWAEYNFKDRDNKNIAPRQLANLLRPYKVKSLTLRIGGQVFKGYRFDVLETVINKYKPLHPPVLSVTPLQVNDTNGSSDILSVTSPNDVTDRKPLQPNDSNGCNGVTDTQGGTREKQPINDCVWEKVIRKHLKRIGEKDPDRVEDIIIECHADPEVLAGYFQRMKILAQDKTVEI